jgi:hypothetical protein
MCKVLLVRVHVGEEDCRWPKRSHARSRQKCQILISCGHTHGGEVQVAENLRVVTGSAEHGRPKFSRFFRWVRFPPRRWPSQLAELPPSR